MHDVPVVVVLLVQDEHIRDEAKCVMEEVAQVKLAVIFHIEHVIKVEGPGIHPD
jgi:hypothetical protein